MNWYCTETGSQSAEALSMTTLCRHGVHKDPAKLQEWERVSTTKKMHRYRPPEVQRAMTELEMAKERLQLAAQQAWAGFMRAFAALYAPFRAAVQALAALDALQSLASLAESPG